MISFSRFSYLILGNDLVLEVLDLRFQPLLAFLGGVDFPPQRLDFLVFLSPALLQLLLVFLQIINSGVQLLLVLPQLADFRLQGRVIQL